MNQSRIEHYEKLLPETAKHTSEMERRADEAEREVEKLKKAEYMKKHIGEEFEGIISSITSWGFYVELANTIEGMVHITSLTDDYYIYLEETYELMGEATNRRFKLGQKVSVVAVKADTLLRTIDFELAE
jgi:ribonuclease R